MITERARVTRLDGEFVWVESASQAGCARCAEGKGCGGSIFSRLLGERLHRIRALAIPGLGVGDVVMLGLDEAGLVSGSLAAYLAPLLAMFAGALLAFEIGGNSDAVTISGAVAGFGAGLVWLRRFTARHADDARYQPRVIRQLGPDDACNGGTD
jgi:sigma-E factor negative regulatory protein RseC